MNVDSSDFFQFCFRDVFNVFLSMDSPQEAEARETSAAIMSYRCPITDLPCQAHPFSALLKCGHVFSQRAIQQVLSVPLWIPQLHGIKQAALGRKPVFNQATTFYTFSLMDPTLHEYHVLAQDVNTVFYVRLSLERSKRSGAQIMLLVQMDQSCGICGRPFDDINVVSINGSKDQVAELTKRMAEGKLALRAKQGKKRKLLLLQPEPDPRQRAV